MFDADLDGAGVLGRYQSTVAIDSRRRLRPGNAGADYDLVSLYRSSRSLTRELRAISCPVYIKQISKEEIRRYVEREGNGAFANNGNQLNFNSIFNRDS